MEQKKRVKRSIGIFPPTPREHEKDELLGEVFRLFGENDPVMRAIYGYGHKEYRMCRLYRCSDGKYYVARTTDDDVTIWYEIGEEEAMGLLAERGD